MKKLLMLSLLCVTVGAFANPRPVAIRTTINQIYSSDDPTVAKKIAQCRERLINKIGSAGDGPQKFRDCIGVEHNRSLPKLIL